MNIDLSVKWGAVLVFGLAGVGRSGTLVWRAAKDRLYWIALEGICMAGGRRPPYITQHLGGRPKVAPCIAVF